MLLGPTGAGKTTTLRLVAGLERADAGRIWIDGLDVTREPPAARDIDVRVSAVFALSASDGLRQPRLSAALAGTTLSPRSAFDAKVREIARLLHIEDKLANRATQLSGGQMQRVAIGRALVRGRRSTLMDEPLSSLDAKLRAEMRVELKRIQRDLARPMLYVTHDQTEAMTLATRYRRAGPRPAGPDRQLRARSMTDPANTYVATRLGSPAINLAVARAATAAARRPPKRSLSARAPNTCASHKASTAVAFGRVHWIEHLGDPNHLASDVGDTSESDLVTLDRPRRRSRGRRRGRCRVHRAAFFDAQGRPRCRLTHIRMDTALQRTTHRSSWPRRVIAHADELTHARPGDRRW